MAEEYLITNEDKKLASIIQKVSRITNEEVGRLVLCTKANQKPAYKLNQQIYGKWFVRANFAHNIEHNLECFTKHPTRPSLQSIIGLFLQAKTALTIDPPTLPIDPLQVFVPSQCLIRKIEKEMISPDEETLEVIDDLKNMQRSSIHEQDMSTIISSEIEDFFTSIARRISITGEQVQISKDDQFTPEIYFELLECLELDPYGATTVLVLLYSELIQFANTTRVRKWGKITVEDSELKLILNENAFTITDIDAIDDDRWTITQ